MVTKNYFYKLGNRFPCVDKIKRVRGCEVIFTFHSLGNYSFQNFREMKQSARRFQMLAHAHRTALALQDRQALL